MDQSDSQILEEEEQPTVFLSQREYVPTPYRDQSWEYVGERLTDLEFTPLRMDVVKVDVAEPDRMFEVFDEDDATKKCEELWHTEDKLLPQEEVEEVERPANEVELAAAAEAGYRKGLQEGQQIAEHKIHEHYEKLSGTVNQVASTLKNEFKEQLARVENDALGLALQISKKILETTVEAKPDYIVEVIRRALADCGAGTPLRIRVSPQDYEFLTIVGLPVDVLPGEAGVQYVADEAISAGCVVETDFGHVDYELDKMWEQIKADLYEAYKK